MLAFSKTLSNPAIDQLAKINLKFSVARKRHFSSERERKRTFINDIIIHKAGSTLAATAKETNHFPRIRVIEYLFVKHVMLCNFFRIFICRVCKVNVQLVHILMHRTYRAYIAEKYVFSIIPCYSMRDTHLLVRRRRKIRSTDFTKKLFCQRLYCDAFPRYISEKKKEYNRRRGDKFIPELRMFCTYNPSKK